MPAQLNATEFLKKLKALSPAKVLSSNQFEAENKDIVLGIGMGQVFALAKEFMNMELDELEVMLQSPVYEMRVGAVSIMDFQARSKKTTETRRKELYELYIRCHGRINTWTMVDRSALWVVGHYLFDKPRKALYKLAKSKMMAERRTAIVSTLYFIRKGDLDDAFKLAEIVLYDKEDLVNKATGWALRFAGDKDRKRLTKFLDKYAATMPRVTLRYAIEKFDKKEREYYLKLKDQE